MLNNRSIRCVGSVQDGWMKDGTPGSHKAATPHGHSRSTNGQGTVARDG